MKAPKLMLAILLLTMLHGCHQSPTERAQSVNAIIGDISFRAAFGKEPTSEADELLRLQTHLKFVEEHLRDKTVSHLTQAQQASRRQLLDLLHEYWTAGIFPKNHDYPGQRIPCFIDRDGKLCAVGYLIEQTAGRALAEAINAKYQYEYVLAMNDQAVDDWIASSGLTKTECAMIQPSYGFARAGHVTPAYGISSSFLGGLNLSLNTLNGIQISQGTHKKIVPMLGLLTGAGQVVLGAVNYPSDQPTGGRGYPDPSRRNLSMINIGLGTSTLILSSWNLITNRKPKPSHFSWNVSSFAAPGNQVGLGFSLTRRL